MLAPAAFRKIVKTHYKKQARHDLSWRHTKSPYHILVSEMMLQQTQVERVIPKYKAFLKAFPTIDDLAKAPLREVLALWVGLGYNRRAKFLKATAEAVVKNRGTFPSTKEALQNLPGIGPYTASAVLAFAYDKPVVMIETNIRTVYIHHYFKDTKETVSDAELLKLIESTLPKSNYREWYYALMDYGTYLKKEFGSNNKRSKNYTKQKTFVGSDRQIRGAIVRTITPLKKSITAEKLSGLLVEYEKSRIKIQLEKLVNEGMITSTKSGFKIAT